MEFSQNGGAFAEILPITDELSTRYYLFKTATFPASEPEGSSSLIPAVGHDPEPVLLSSYSHNALLSKLHPSIFLLSQSEHFPRG
jgi:hypothetical protein